MNRSASIPRWVAGSVLAVIAHLMILASGAGADERESEPSTASPAAARPRLGPNALWPDQAARDAELGLVSRPTPSPNGSVHWDGVWERLSPPWRLFHSAVYDPVKKRMLVFGGSDGVTRNDVWAFSLSGSPRWEKLEPQGDPPAPRGSALAVYDPVRRRLIVFGGSDRPGTAEASIYGDLWELKLDGRPLWRELHPEGVAPAPRQGASGVYDPRRDRIVFFGGLDTNVWTDETWELKLGLRESWHRLEPAGERPEARWGHAAILDPENDRMVIFGGNMRTAGSNNDLWELNLDGATTWSRVRAVGEQPPPMRWHTAVLDAERRRMLVYGGAMDGYPYANERTWALSLDAEPKWEQVAAAPTPPAHVYHSTIVDPDAGQMLVFGTFGGVAKVIWALDLKTSGWSSRYPRLGSPTYRVGGTFVHDSRRDRMITYGTKSPAGPLDFALLGSPWSLDLESAPPVWEPLAGPWPTLSMRRPSAYDSIEDRVLVVGDESRDLHTVWELRFGASPGWSPISVPGPAPFIRVLREEVTFVADGGSRRIVGFGFGAGQETWSLDFDETIRWERWEVADPPPARYLSTAALDTKRERMLLFGGYDATGITGDVWSLSLNEPHKWEKLLPAGVPPTSRFGSALAYDPTRDRLLVFGGETSSGNSEELWALELSGTPAWKLLMPRGESPIGRNAASTFFDTRRQRMLIFGGQGQHLVDDLWALDLHDQGSSAAPAPGVGQMSSAHGIENSAPEASAGALDRALRIRVRPDLMRGPQIELRIPSRTDVRLTLWDIQGRSRGEKLLADLPAGRHALAWEQMGWGGGSLSSGLYIVRVEAGSVSSTTKVVIAR